MPSPRRYENRAAQQAAYRKRQALSQAALLSQKGLPPLPAIPTLPGQARWRAMLIQAHLLLSEAMEEMQSYHDDRSEIWQESERGKELLAKQEHLQDTLSHLEEIM